MMVLTGQIAKTGHFLHPTAIATGQSFMGGTLKCGPVHSTPLRAHRGAPLENAWLGGNGRNVHGSGGSGRPSDRLTLLSELCASANRRCSGAADILFAYPPGRTFAAGAPVPAAWSVSNG